MRRNEEMLIKMWMDDQTVVSNNKIVNVMGTLGMSIIAAGIVVVLLCSGCAVANADVVSVARSQIGVGEIGGDNRGANVRKYTRGQEVAWCAGFVSWTLSKSGKRTPYLLSALSYYKQFKHVKSPKPGDIIVFKRGKTGGHVGIVERVKGGRITTIEGNVGAYPARVKRITYQVGHIKNLLGFVRI